jgi:hypothetical protein
MGKRLDRNRRGYYCSIIERRLLHYFLRNKKQWRGYRHGARFMGKKQQVMINIEKRAFKNDSGNPCIDPVRQLTAEEKATVIASWGDDKNYWHFQAGDESSPEWAEYISHINQPPQESPSAAMLAFANASYEEKKAIAEELKQFLT